MSCMGVSSTGRPRGRPRKGNEADVHARESLIAPALHAFAAHGYAGATIDEVLRLAQVSKGAFYYHFGGKEELFAAVIGERIDAPARALMRITATAPSDRPTSSTVSHGLAELFTRERRTVLLVEEWRIQATRDPALARRWRSRQRQMRDSLSEALTQRHATTGVPLTFDAARLAEAFLVLAHGLAVEMIVDPNSVDAELFGDVLAVVYEGLAARST